jgi:hypothetical protein
MSVIVDGNNFLYAFSDAIRQNYYMSNYYALTNQNVFIQYKNPVVLSNSDNFALSGYITNFGDNNETTFSLPDQPVYHKYQAEGTYFIAYTAVYLKNSNFEYIPYVTDYAFNIKSNWDIYDPVNIRLNEEAVLNLPYNLEEIQIQPNEWGISDVFNTSILRLQECLEYLIAKTQTINTYAPTLFYGWLGNNSGTKASNLKWFTKTYNQTFIDTPEISYDTGNTYFSNVIDVANIDSPLGELLYVLDNKNLRLFFNLAEPIEVSFTNGDPLSGFLIDPVSIDINEDGSILYIVDKIQNTVFKLNIQPNFDSTATIYIQLFVGGFGGLQDNDNFNTPTQIVYRSENVYVVDYNNFGVKVFNKDLNWIFTYYIDEFADNKPISVEVLPNGLIYILTETYKIYIFDGFTNEVFEIIELTQPKDDSNLLKICFDSQYNFLHILTEKNLYKYTLTGMYVTTFILPKTDDIKYTNVRRSNNNLLFITSPKCIFKNQDILQVFRLGEGLETKYWSKDQMTVTNDNFISDLYYNLSLNRIAQNIISFRDSLNAKFIIATENVRTNIVTYFSYLPITQKPELNEDVENFNIGVGVNELNIPPVLNRELQKLYYALLYLADFLSIKNYSVNNLECLDSFCWSWNSTSCYELKLPVLKTCSINPISYREIYVGEQNNMIYAPSLTWEQAISKCCEDK